MGHRGGWGIRLIRLGGQGGCELRSEAFVKIIFFLGGGGGGSGQGGGVGLGGGQDGWEWRIEAFVKIQKKKIWGGGCHGGRWVMWGMGDVNQE